MYWRQSEIDLFVSDDDLRRFGSIDPLRPSLSGENDGICVGLLNLMIFIGFVALLTLRRIGRRCPSDGAGGILRTRSGRAERSINLVKAGATLDPG